MARKYASCIALGVLLSGLVSASLGAESTARSIETMRNQVNAGTVGIVSGGVDGTYVRIAADLAAVLDNTNGLRVLSLIGKGSLQNLADIIFLRGIDVGIVQSDVLAYAKRERLYPGLDKSVQYIAKLYDEEMHILAGRDIATVADLAGKKVNVDLSGSGTSMTTSIVFGRLGVPVQQTNFDQALALEKLKQGEIAALVYIAGKPARLFRDLRAEDELHFVPIPASAELLDTYLPAQLTHEDYPVAVPNGGTVETVAVGAVMAVYNWAPNTERYGKVARFIDAFFGHFDAFLEPPRHPKWKEVNLAARVPSWTRFAAAENWLERETTVASGNSPLRKDFETFLNLAAGADRPVSEVQKTTLFEEFVRWQQSPARERR
jgi:TRAP transporter TAXI family solute receptor